MSEYKHFSVMLDETVNFLLAGKTDSKVIVDCTVGLGGHSEKILESVAGEKGFLFGFDRDGEALKKANDRLKKYAGSFKFFNNNFSEFEDVFEKEEIDSVDGFLFDLGISSMQIDDASRGFSFSKDAALDMRMDKRQQTTAADLVNELSKDELIRILREYGEERLAVKIVNKIISYREDKEISSTLELAEIVKSVYPKNSKKFVPDAKKVMRTFQALRIAVNDEIDGLGKVMQSAVSRLNTGGRIAVITFHSLEDRIIKKTFKELSAPCTCPPDFPVCACGKKASLKLINTKPIVAGDNELDKNTRSRSAKLRVAEKI